MPEDGLDHVVFKATLNDRHTDVRVEAGVVAPADDPALDHPQSLEQALKDVLRELRESPPAIEPQPSGKPQAVAVIPDSNAAVAKTEDEVLTAAIRGARPGSASGQPVHGRILGSCVGSAYMGGQPSTTASGRSS
ncbi:hypothetical protein [Saccharothrix texasensis]|uniref:Uncharacterized protein n=1 Tax=Saccharothrix texasensis TaxID=103734 RepID=A0A3N1HI88_9PSEU|nr:hypothetical protein [Saccharothrix texasensis]ROP42210.1 hypothetical protein EDD40_7706 [Saccharothrix texasensis]